MQSRTPLVVACLTQPTTATQAPDKRPATTVSVDRRGLGRRHRRLHDRLRQLFQGAEEIEVLQTKGCAENRHKNTEISEDICVGKLTGPFGMNEKCALLPGRGRGLPEVVDHPTILSALRAFLC